VQADWPPQDEDDLKEMSMQTGHHMIEGMTMWQVGFERVDAAQVYPTYFVQAAVSGLSQYTRPPALAVL
jgi:hypothetical protein